MRAKKIARVTGKMLGFTLLGIIALIALVLIAAHTPWGKEEIRKRAVVAVNGAITGTVAIGAIDGFFLDEITLRDVSLIDSAGRTAVEADAVSVDFDLLSLLSKEVDLSLVLLERPAVLAVTEEDGQLNFAKLVKPSNEPPKPKDPNAKPWTIRVGSALIDDGFFTYAASGSTLTVSRINLDAGAKIIGENMSVDLRGLAAHVADPSLDVKLSGQFDKTATEALVEQLEVALQGAKALTVDKARYGLVDGAAHGTLHADISDEVLRRLTRDRNWRGGVAFDGRLAHESNDRPWVVSLEGALAGAPLAVTATAASDLAGGKVHLTLNRFNPSALHALGPKGRLDLRVDGDAIGKSLVDLRGKLAGDISGQIQYSTKDMPVVIRKGEIRAEAGGRPLEASIDLDTDRGTVSAKTQLDPSPLYIREAIVSVNLRDFGAFLPAEMQARGAVRADIAAVGTPDNLSARGKVAVDKLRFGDIRASAIRSRIDLSGVPNKIGGALDLDLRGGQVGERSLGELDLTARFSAATNRAKIIVDGRNAEDLERLTMRAELKRLDHAIEVVFSQLDFVSRKIPVKLKGGAYVAIDNHGPIRVRGIDLRSPAGNIQLDARFNPKRLVDGPGDVQATFTEINLPRLRSAFAPSAPKMRGNVNGRLVAQTGLKSGAKVIFEGQASQVRTGAARQPLAANWQVNLENSKFEAKAAVWGRRLGRVTFEARGTTPRDLDNPRAWEALGPDVVNHVLLKLHHLSMAEIASLMDQPAKMGGVLEGEIELAGIDRIKADITGRALRVDPVEAPIELKLHAVTHEGRFDTEIAAAISGQPAVGVLLSVDHDPQAFRNRGFAALLDADASGRIRLDDFPLALLRGAEAAAAEIDEDVIRGKRAVVRSRKGKQTAVSTVEGILTLHFDFTRKNRHLKGDLMMEGKDLVWANEAPKLDTKLIGTIGGGLATLKGHGRGKDLGWLEIDAAAKVPRDVFDSKAWAGVDHDAVKKLWLNFKDLDLKGLDKMARGALKMRGHVSGRVLAHESLDAADVYVSMRGVAPDKMKDHIDGELLVTADEKDIELVLGGFHESRQIIDAKIQSGVGLTALLKGGEALERSKIDGKMRIDRFPMPLVAELIRSQHEFGGAVTGTIAFGGTVNSPKIALRLDAAGATIDNYEFHNFDVVAALNPEKVTTEVHLREGKYGKLDLTAELERGHDAAPVKARLDSHRFRLGWLTALLPPGGTIGGIAGRLDAAVDLTGNLGDPSAKGKIELRNFKFVMAPPIPPLQRGRAVIDLDGRRVAVDLKGDSDDGEIEMTADVDLKRLNQPDFEARIVTDDVPVTAGPKRLLVDSVTTVRGQTRETMAINIRIERGLVEIPNEGAEKLQKLTRFDDIRFIGVDSPEEKVGPPKTPMEIKVELVRPIPLRGKEINAVGDVKLSVTDASGLMEMSGYATVSNGYLNVFGKRWDIQKSRVDFIPGEEPHVDVELTHDFSTVVVYIKVNGSAMEPDLTLSSEPAIYDEAQLLSFVIGSGPSSETPQDSSIGEQAAGAAANALIGQIQSKLEDELPIDTLRVEMGAGAQVSRLSLGKWISSRLFLGYDHNFDAEEDENISEGVLQYRIGKGWMLETRYGDQGNGGVDALWVKRF